MIRLACFRASAASACFMLLALAQPAAAVTDSPGLPKPYCLYTATPPTLTDKEVYPFRCDASGLPLPPASEPPAATVTTTDKSGTITAGGTAQVAIASNASRRAWCIQNDPAATEPLYVRVNGTAASGIGAALSPGDQACSSGNIVDTAGVSVFAATTGHVFEGFEKQ